MGNPFQWEHDKAMQYNETIRKRILNYASIFEVMQDIVVTDCREVHSVAIVGAGGGQELSTLIDDLPKACYFAIDPSEKMLELAKYRLIQEGKEADIQYIAKPFHEVEVDAVDLITCHLVLHFLQTDDEKRQLIQAISKRLKVGGTLFLSSINGKIGRADFEQQLDVWHVGMLRKGVTEKEWEKFRASIGEQLVPITDEEVVALLQQYGLSLLYHYEKTHVITASYYVKIR